MASRLRKNEENMVCTPTTIRVEAKSAGRMASREPKEADPLEQDLAVDAEADGEQQAADAQAALQAVVGGDGGERPVGAQHADAEGVALGVEAEGEYLVAQDGEHAAEDHEVDVEVGTADLDGAGQLGQQQQQSGQQQEQSGEQEQVRGAVEQHEAQVPPAVAPGLELDSPLRG